MTTPPQVYLRALDEGDLERTLRWHNDPALYATMGEAFRFVSKTAEVEWLGRKSRYAANEVNLAICLGVEAEHIGNAYLREIDWVSRKATLHIFIGSPKKRGKGYGKQAVQQLLRHAFLDLNLNRVGLEVLADNAPAIKIYEQSGFVAEGRLRDYAFKNGEYQDALVMGIRAEDFRRDVC